ncbi:MAG: hypothetical protein ACFB2Z_00070 [Maricaulaceae bacterium]
MLRLDRVFLSSAVLVAMFGASAVWAWGLAPREVFLAASVFAGLSALSRFLQSPQRLPARARPKWTSAVRRGSL